METEEYQRRRRERIAVGVILALLFCLTLIEVQILKLSAKLPIVSSVFFFGIMNLNLVLVMVLLFLVFRNAVKVILDERKGKIGAKLKTRLVFSFLAFAMIPTILLFTISAFYIKNSFDKWWNVKVGNAFQRSIDVVRHYYENTEKNAKHFAQKIGANFIESSLSPDLIAKKIEAARLEYDLDAVEYYENIFTPRIYSSGLKKTAFIPPASVETLKRLFSGNEDCKILNIGSGELIRCGLLIGTGRGGIFVDYFVPMNLAAQLSEVQLTYSEYKKENPLNYPIKSTYFMILLMVTLLILFSAAWTGFYVAKRLTNPIEELSRGTEALSKGNLDYQIPESHDDEFGRLIHSFNEMTREIKMGNEELVKRQKSIEVLIENVQSGVVSLDENGNISMVNSAASRLLGMPLESLLGRPYNELFPSEYQSELRETLIHLYSTSKPIRREFKIKNFAGTYLHVMATFSVLRDDLRKQMGVVAVLEDVTEIQKIERMNAWREVARRMAHEVKNPLTPIQLSIERLRRRYLDKIQDDGTFDNATKMVLKEVESLKNLVGEFNSFARLPDTQLAPDELNEIIIEAANLFRSAHDAILFDLQLESKLPILLLDRSQLKRALINLFDNAVSAMKGEGTISVKTEYKPSFQTVSIMVSDQGEGISPDKIPMLFEPYFSTKQGGTGLGLAIVQRIVLDHRGFIRVTHNQPQGAVFTIEFPESLQVKELSHAPEEHPYH